MKRARFAAAARREFLAEVAFYNVAQDGLGARFASAVEEASARARISIGRIAFARQYAPGSC